MRRVISAATLFAILPNFLYAQDANDAPEPYLLLTVNRSCGTEEDDKRLADAIRLRIPRVFIVRGDAEGKTPDWRVTWRPENDASCVLDFAAWDNNSTMELGPEASSQDIELAASRVAWLASISVPESERVAVDENPDTDKESPAKEDEKPEEKPEEKIEKPEEKPKGDVTVEPENPDPVVQKLYQDITWKFSLVPSLSVVSSSRANPVAKISMNLFGGSGIGLRGFEIGFGWNHQSDFAHGGQLSLGANSVDGDVDGVQIAIGANLAGERSSATQIAVGYNRIKEDSFGIQFAVGANHSVGNFRGFQLSTGVNVAKDVHGFQMAAITNIASGNTAGFQLAPLNIGGRVDGVQVGIINIAETSDLSLGIVNVLWGEPLYFTAFVSSESSIIAGIQHGGRFLRYALLVGYRSGPETDIFQLGGGLGLHVGDRIFWDTDLFFFQTVLSGEPIERVSPQLKLKTAIGYQVYPRLAVFAGVDLNLLVTGQPFPEQLVPSIAVDIEENTGEEVGVETSIWLWPGIHAGVRF